jgi:PAS domain S-box-containing protein
MKDATVQRSRSTGVLMAVAAVAAAVTYFTLPVGSRTQALASEALIVTTCLLAGGSIARMVGRGAWRGFIWLAWGLLAIASVNGLFFALNVLESGRYEPRATDLAFLVFLVPLIGLARAENRRHAGDHDRGELNADVMLITASVTVIGYLLIRPSGADVEISISSLIFAVLAATQITAFGALVVWAPSRVHVVQWMIFVALGAATVGFGWQWSHHALLGTAPWIDLTFALCPLAFGAMVAFLGWSGHAADTPREPSRWGRPLLTSLSVVAASAALILVATLNVRTGLDGVQSAAIIGLLGIGVAARIVANQVASAQAHRDVRTALADKELALSEADDALAGERDANDTLSQSEEHLRLVFEAAVDGVVELDERGVVIRTNGAFCRMVGMGREAIEGEPWSALAAAVTGADQAFAALPKAGQAQLKRADGQPLHLESRVSEIPTTPPRTLMVVRDVTAARVADQTIRSLFTFLQDRDEDRTRLLRRTNAAIESERNRIARDLHDGPVQGVSAASLSLEAALLMIEAGKISHGLDVLGKVRDELTAEADALRRLMSGLRPPVLEERGLVPAIREMVSRFGEDHGVHTEFIGRIGAKLPDELETLVYRVVQEALSNASRHADAAMLTVTMETDGGQLRIEVQDDGQGFETSHTRMFLREGRVGLASMRERVELAGGTFVVRSSPGRGVTIMATVSLETVDIERELAVNEVS